MDIFLTERKNIHENIDAREGNFSELANAKHRLRITLRSRRIRRKES